MIGRFLLVFDDVPHVQGATRVTLARDVSVETLNKVLPHVACGGAVLAGDADVPVIHIDGELEGAGGVGDRVHGGVPQHWRDPVRGVTGLPPA